MTQLSAKATLGSPASLAFPAKLAMSSLRDFTPRVALRGLFCAVLVCAASAEAVRFGVVERPLSLYSSVEDIDPVIAKVGSDVLRVSDAVAHANYTGAEADDVSELIASGAVDEAADHLALAQLAREQGLADALEIRAAVALAEREILATAFLDQIAQQSSDEEAVRAAYEAERAEMERQSVMRLSKIVLTSEDTAKSVRARLPRADFATLAKQKSADKATALTGGYFGDLTIGELPEPLAAAVSELAIGGVTEPVATEEGWVIVKLESRRAVRLAPFEERKDAIAAALRQEAVEAALSAATDVVPTQIRSAESIARAAENAPLGVLASARGL